MSLATTASAVIRTMRPRQWAKNVLLLAGLYFPSSDGEGPLLLDPASLLRAACGFAVFCLLAGTVYLVNDAVDAESDKLHPKKRFRPIPAGDISPAGAVFAAFLTGTLGMAGAFQLSPAFFLCATAYLGMEILYSLLLKEVFLIDTLVISMGFILRAVSGIIVLRSPEQMVPLTPWFVVCVLFLSLLLAFCKRRAELMADPERAVHQRNVLRSYSESVLDAGIGVSATAAIISYALYSIESPQPWEMLATMPFVIYGVFRYLHLTYEHGLGEAPEEVLLHDRAMLGCIALWAMALLLVFYPLA